MVTTIETAFNPRQNAIGFLRFFFAALVVFSHSFPLGGFATEPLWRFSRGQEHFGTIAVMCFFIVSGFLITRSRASAKTTADYLWHRFLRIMPGFWACLLVTAVLFAPLAYWLEHGALRGVSALYDGPVLTYLKANWRLTIRIHNIGDLLQHLPMKGAINGSLWTLDYEFRCYLCIAVLGLFGWIMRLRMLTLAITLLLYGVHIRVGANPEALARLVPHFADVVALKLALYFFVGATFFLYKEYVPMNAWLAATALLLAGYGLYAGCFRVTGPLCLSYVVLYTACRLPITDFDRRGDFSYGLYLYAFPVQQLLSLAGIPRVGYLPYFLCSLSLSAGFGMLSYFMIEKPALALKSVRIRVPYRDWFRLFNPRRQG